MFVLYLARYFSSIRKLNFNSYHNFKKNPRRGERRERPLPGSQEGG
jgi:hypothetical protein